MKKWEDIKDFSFPYLCLIGRVDKLRDEKRVVWLRKKKMRELKIEFVYIFHHVLLK